MIRRMGLVWSSGRHGKQTSMRRTKDEYGDNSENDGKDVTAGPAQCLTHDGSTQPRGRSCSDDDRRSVFERDKWTKDWCRFDGESCMLAAWS